jgi:diguanylate cyclase (GGDEF)-like protein
LRHGSAAAAAARQRPRQIKPVARFAKKCCRANCLLEFCSRWRMDTPSASPLAQFLLNRSALQSHALFRLGVCALAALYAATISPSGTLQTSSADWVMLALAILVSVSLMFAPAQERPARKALELVFDHAAPCWALWRFGVAAAPLLVCTFFTCIAYGYRFGWRYTLYSAAASIAALLALTEFSAQWAPHQLWILVMGTSLLLVALCTPVLLSRLQSAQANAETAENEVLHDELTGLGNMNLLRERLRNALRQAERYGNGVGLLSFNLDDFVRVNAKFGHNAGDALLRQIARRIENNIRGADLLCRTGGDEFTLLVERLNSGTGCERVAEVVLRELKAIAHSSERITVSASIGIVVYRPAPEEALARTQAQVNRSAEELIEQATAAMRRAKLQGKARWCIAGNDAARVDALRKPDSFAR